MNSVVVQAKRSSPPMSWTTVGSMAVLMKASSACKVVPPMKMTTAMPPLMNRARQEVSRVSELVELAVMAGDSSNGTAQRVQPQQWLR